MLSWFLGETQEPAGSRAGLECVGHTFMVLFSFFSFFPTRIEYVVFVANQRHSISAVPIEFFACAVRVRHRDEILSQSSTLDPKRNGATTTKGMPTFFGVWSYNIMIRVQMIPISKVQSRNSSYGLLDSSWIPFFGLSLAAISYPCHAAGKCIGVCL